MSKLEDIINQDLLVNKKEKRMITVNVEEELIEKLDKIAKQFSRINNGKNFSRKYLVKTAIEAYIDEATRILKKNFDVEIASQEKKKEEKEPNMVIYPGNIQGFEECFILENQWKYVRMDEKKKANLKYIAIYVTAPTQGITHYAKIKKIVYDENKKKNIIFLEDNPIKLDRIITRGSLDPNSIRSPRYIRVEDFKRIKSLDEIL